MTKSTNISVGQTIINQIRKVAGGKFQLQLIELITPPNATVSAASLLNESDERFTSRKPRYAWVTGEAADLKAKLNIDVAKLKFTVVDGKEVAELNIINPSINGQRMRVRILDNYEKSYETQSPKQYIGKDGSPVFFTRDGKHIYSSTDVVLGEAKHNIINADTLVDANGAIVRSMTTTAPQGLTVDALA